MDTLVERALQLLNRGAPAVNPQSEAGAAAGVGLTALDVASAAARAECAPEHLPLLLAAVRAVSEPRLNVAPLLESGDPASFTMLVSGSAVRSLAIGAGVASPDGAPQLNARLARALHLALATALRGSGRLPGGYALTPGACFGEDEQHSSWPSLAEERGFSAGASAVTLFATFGSVPLRLSADAGAEEILQTLARAMMAGSVAEDVGLVGGGEPLLVLSADLAQRLEAEGFDRGGTRRELWRRARLRLRDLAAATRDRIEAARRARGESDPETPLPVALRSADISLAVTGSAGLRAVYLPGWPGGTRSVTIEVGPAIC